MNNVTCPSCGQPNPAGFRFCGACGASMERACPSCGAVNPAGFRFCGTCGAALDGSSTPAAAAPRAPDPVVEELEERKVVTSLFADLTASTEIAARLDPEDLRRVLGPFFDAMAEEIARYGGTVEKFIGDAIVAFFGVPVAHEDDPERAIRAGLAMQGRLAELNRELAERAGGDLAIRIGINTGEVFAHGGGIDEGLVTGEAVNIAARFQALADPGSVVVGERSWRDTRHAFSFRPLGEVTVKGIDRPLLAFEVEAAVATPRTAPAMTAAPLVGRRSEMELLRLLFERTVRERRANLVTIVGPPGIGKSRLSHELVTKVVGERDGVRVVRGRCLPYGDGLTYWPMAEILKADAGILDSDPPEVFLGKARAHLEPRFDGRAEGIGVTAALLSSIGVPVPSDPLAGAEPAAAKRLIARAWRRYLEAMAAEGPVVALIEDVHWADPNLLDLVESLVARVAGPALVLCMARPDLFERRPDWAGGLSNATTLALSPLTTSEGTSLLEHLLDGDAPPEVVGPILHRSEGNPFFAGELLRMMLEDGTLERKGGRWTLVRDLPSVLPDTVQGVIVSRIDLLAPQEKRAIQDASVVGRVFWQGALERLGSPAAEDALDALVAKGLIWEREASAIVDERELIFNHILTRDVAYSSIPLARRAEAHGAVGAWIEERTAGRADEFAEVLAFHFELAGDRGRTARYALLAGNRHLRVFASEEAIRWYERGLIALDGLGSGPAAGGDGDLAGLLALARGQAHEQVGQLAEARDDYERSLARARAAGDAALEARSLAALAHAWWTLDRYDEGQALLPEALEKARAVGAADVEARLLYTAGTIRFGRGEFAEALPLHERALEVAEASGDVEGQGLAHHGLCETRFFLGPASEGLRRGERADELLRALGQRQMVAHNAYMVGWVRWLLGELPEALETIEASIADSREIGNGRDEAFALAGRIEILLAEGDLAGALADADTCIAMMREARAPRGELIAQSLRAFALSEAWAVENVAAAVEAGLELSDRIGGRFQRTEVLASQAWVRMHRSDPVGVAQGFEEARRLADGGWLDELWVGRQEVLAWERSPAPGPLEAVGVRLEARAGDSLLFGPWGTFARALGALVAGDAAGALDLGSRALQVASSTGQARLEWRAGGVVASAQEALGLVEEATAARARARETLERSLLCVPAELRPGFLARPDVSSILGGD